MATAKRTAKAKKTETGKKMPAGVYVLMAIAKNSGSPLHRHCSTFEQAESESKAENVNWDYPIYVKLPTGEMHIINQPK